MHVAFVNISRQRQIRWAQFSVPTALAVADVYKSEEGNVYAFKGKKIGSLGYLYYARLILEGGAKRVIRFCPTDRKIPGYQWWPEVENPGRCIEDHPVRKVFHSRTESAEIWKDNFKTYWLAQDIVDHRSGVRWSGRGSPAWRCSDLLLINHDSRSHVYGESRAGLREGTGITDFPDATIIPATAVTWPQLSPDDTDFDMRIDQISAAQGGPIIGLCSGWNGRWFGQGGRFDTEEFFFQIDEARRLAHELYLQGDGQWDDRRPIALRKYPGGTGDQGVFAATFGEELLARKDPAFLWELMWSADDYLLRPFHHLEEDGSRVTAENHPDWVTWSAMTHVRVEGDYLGKHKERPWDWTSRPGPDDQHDAYLPVAAVEALTGDPLLREGRLDMIETDLAQQEMMGAPRAFGRLAQKWQTWLMLADDDTEVSKILDIINKRLKAWDQWLDHHGLDGFVVTPGQVVVQTGPPETSRTLRNGAPYWAPWQDSLMVLGLYQLGCVINRLKVHDTMADRLFNLARPIAENYVKNGIVHNENTGERRVGLAIEWLEDGSRQDDSYYNFDRREAVEEQPVNGIENDLLYGADYWWNWGAPGVLVAHELSENDEVLELCESFKSKELLGRDPTWLTL